MTERQRARTRRQRIDKPRPVGGADAICEALLVIVVLGSVLAVGTVHVPVLLCVSALALAGGTLAVMAFRTVPWPAIVLAAFAGISALQALPLPAGLVQRLSPASSDVWLRCLVPFGEQPLARFPVSLDGGASILEALKWLTYAAVYIMASRVRARRGSAWLALLLFASATIVTLITLVHGVANVRELYGFYQSNFAIGRWNVGPLQNSNNLAGYAILGLFAGGGLLLSERSALPRLPLLIGLGVISAALCLSGSRAAVFSALASGGVVLVWLANVQRVRLSTRRLLLGVAPFLVAMAIAIALGTVNDWSALASVDARRKVAVWAWSLPMIRDHFWLGIGRGAFETAFPPYRLALVYDWTSVPAYAENFAVQWVAEWGVPAGLCAVVLIVGYVLREWYASRRDCVRFMLMTGLVALLVQNCADLGLEIPAVAIAAVLVLAAGERPSPRALAQAETRIGLRALPAAALLLCVWGAALFFSSDPVESERRDLSSSYRELPVKSVPARAEFRSTLRDAVLRHPGESFFPLLGSLVAFRSGDGNPLPWIARALELAPTNGRVHLVLAQLLAAHHAVQQAMLHLRLTAEYDRTLGGTAGGLAARWAPSLDILLEAIPEGPGGYPMLLEACARGSRLELKIACFRTAATRNPGDFAARAQLTESLLSALRSAQAPCTGALADGCAQEADAAVRAMAKLEPRSWRPGYLMAKLLLARGDAKGAAQLLAKTCPQAAEGTECARDAVTAALQSGSDDAILAAADSYAARPCENGASCAQALDWLGTSLDSAGKMALAVRFYAKAAEADESAARWLKVAERAVRARSYGLARSALERADRSPDATPNTRAHSALLMRRVVPGLNAGPP